MPYLFPARPGVWAAGRQPGPSGGDQAPDSLSKDSGTSVDLSLHSINRQIEPQRCSGLGPKSPHEQWHLKPDPRPPESLPEAIHRAPCGRSWPMSPSWASVFYLLIRGRCCAQQSQASGRTLADSSRPVGGPETDLGGLGTSKAGLNPSLQEHGCQRAPWGSRQAEGGAWGAAAVPASERPEEGELASACSRSHQLEGLPATYRRGLPGPSQGTILLRS